MISNQKVIINRKDPVIIRWTGTEKKGQFIQTFLCELYNEKLECKGLFVFEVLTVYREVKRMNPCPGFQDRASE